MLVEPEIVQELGWLATGAYPPFVTARRPPEIGSAIPVFVFHTIEPVSFEAQLARLAENGYRTATSDELHDHLVGRGTLPRQTVLLTLDDGRSSVWTHGYPLLRKYGFRAVVFLIPGFMRPGDTLRPSLADVWAGRLDPSELVVRDPDLITWLEARAMHDSGTIDCQSHTRFHHRLPAGDRLVDYVHPGLGAALWDIPMSPGEEQRLLEGGIGALLGTPLFESAAPMAGQPCYRISEDLVLACRQHVAAHGGRRFFARRRWRGELKSLVASWIRHHGPPGIPEDADATRRRMLFDLAESRADIEARLPGKEVRHLCLPYTTGSTLALELAREAGYRTVLWGVTPGRTTNAPGDDPYRCPRLKGDYIARLPGRRRASLASVIWRKTTRRLSGQPIY